MTTSLTRNCYYVDTITHGVFIVNCYLVEGKGIEPLTHACKAHVFPLAPTPRKTWYSVLVTIQYLRLIKTLLIHFS